MKKYYYISQILFLFLIISSCNLKSNTETFFNGKIIKKTSDTITLLKDENIINKSKINEDGTFSMVNDALENGLYNFQLPPEFQYLLLNQGDSLALRLNSLDFDESLVFIGKGSSKNNFLMDVFLNHEKEEKIINSSLGLKPNIFKKLIDSLLAIKNNSYENFNKITKLTSIEKLIIENAIKLPLYTKMETYISLKIKNNNLYNIEKSFFDFRTDVGFELEELVHFKPYLDYLIIRSNNHYGASYNTYENNDLQFNLERIKFIDINISNEQIKSKVLRYIAFEYLLKEKKLIDIDTFLNLFYDVSPNELINLEIEELYNDISFLQIGKLLPKIDLTDLKNNRDVTLQNKKPIVFFFWSYDQSSHQAGIFERVNKILNKNKNFIFYSVNINRDHQKWREYVLNLKKIEGIKHYRSIDFENMSKRMVLNNLNKVIVTDKNLKIIQVSDITSILNFIEKF